MLKRTITSAEYDALPDDVKGHYIKRGSSYAVDLEGADPELTATQGQLDNERRKSIELASQVRQLTADSQGLEERVRGEVAKEIKTLKDANEALTTSQINAEREKHINAIASQFKLENLIRADLNSRVDVSVVDGQVKTTFKDKDGKEIDFKALSDEYCKNPDYSAILKTNENTPSYKAPASDDNGNGGSQGVQKPPKGGINYATATTAEIAADVANRVTTQKA